VSRLEEITARLRAITTELSNPELEDERAGELTREAAGLAAEASEEVDRTLSQASQDE
jgi:hypothetical protein